jgi:hypothetical protein
MSFIPKTSGQINETEFHYQTPFSPDVRTGEINNRFQQSMSSNFLRKPLPQVGPKMVGYSTVLDNDPQLEDYPKEAPGRPLKKAWSLEIFLNSFFGAVGVSFLVYAGIIAHLHGKPVGSEKSWNILHQIAEKVCWNPILNVSYTWLMDLS